MAMKTKRPTERTYKPTGFSTIWMDRRYPPIIYPVQLDHEAAPGETTGEYTLAVWYRSSDLNTPDKNDPTHGGLIRVDHFTDSWVKPGNYFTTREAAVKATQELLRRVASKYTTWAENLK